MKTIPLSQGQVALVDDINYDWLNQWKWCAHKDHTTYYAVRTAHILRQKHTLKMHRVIMNAPPGMQVDHIDHNGLNDQEYNLRLATGCQNNQNQRKTRGLSKYKGVCFDRRNNCWIAQIGINSEGAFLGAFNEEIVAALAYDCACREAYGEFACPNFSENDYSQLYHLHYQALHAEKRLPATSQHLNIHWCNERNKWRVKFKHNGKRYYVGSFDDEAEAFLALKEAIAKAKEVNP